MLDRETLNLVIVGHVDHGKSTLIGRLLYDTGSLPAETIAELRSASEELGHELELAYAMDHLAEERAESMTIDTAQAFFKTAKRDYVIIDAPGHKQFIKNMITGASQSEAAVLMVDVTEGICEQTRRHAYFVNILGISQLVVVINKMDKVEYGKELCDTVATDATRFLDSVGLNASYVIPGSASRGDNVVRRSDKMPWYDGPTLVEALDRFGVVRSPRDRSLRFSVQDVYTLKGNRVLVGRVETGELACGQEVVFLPSRSHARVATVEVFGEDRSSAHAGECIGITIDHPALLDRGEIACSVGSLPEVTRRFRGNVFWMSTEPCNAGAALTLRVATQETRCVVERIETRIDASTLAVLEENAAELCEIEVGRMILATDRPLVLESFHETPELGRFVLARGPHIVGGGVVSHESWTHLA